MICSTVITVGQSVGLESCEAGVQSTVSASVWEGVVAVARHLGTV